MNTRETNPPVIAVARILPTFTRPYHYHLPMITTMNEDDEALTLTINTSDVRCKILDPQIHAGVKHVLLHYCMDHRHMTLNRSESAREREGQACGDVRSYVISNSYAIDIGLTIAPGTERCELWSSQRHQAKRFLNH